MIQIETLVLGPVETNVYIIADDQSGESVVIDPAWDGELIAKTALGRGWKITQIWLTHAHFDHLAGVSGLVKNLDPPPRVALHEADLPFWQERGGAQWFGFHIDPGPMPEIWFEHGELVTVGDIAFEVRHAPGHTPGHVIFYSVNEKVVFCGDVIFMSGIGRTDFPGGNFQQLMDSIKSQILTLPDDTALYSGHGSPTSVGVERRTNYFLNEYD